MTRQIDTIAAIASGYDVIVFDQWGVLHDGSAPYPGAVTAVDGLGATKAVLSNSGKRAAPNADRIAAMGFANGAFDFVMTSGEALWQDIHAGQITERRFFAVERQSGDAAIWADGLGIELCADARNAEAILMMGLPDGTAIEDWTDQLASWRRFDLPIYCSNPDRQSPRAGGCVMSPGALAFAYRDLGGVSVFYGKPHKPVFAALEQIFGPGRYLMIGDSMEHDIAGAHGAGWDSLLIEGGLYADRFATGDGNKVVAEIAAEQQCAPPTYRMRGLR